MAAPLLLTAHDATGHIHLIIGSNPLANARCAKSIQIGAKPVLLACRDADFHYALHKKIEEGTVEWLKRGFKDEDLKSLGRDEVDNHVDAVFITLGERNPLSMSLEWTNQDVAKIGVGHHVSTLCRKLRIPVNVTDAPSLSTFTILSTHSDGPLQIGITTSGNGCKLASRIRREIASSLPPDFGVAIDRLGAMRRRIWEEDHKLHGSTEPGPDDSDDDAMAQKPTFNKLVTEADYNAVKTRRTRWLSQICEYWPLRRLAAISDTDIDKILRSYSSPGINPSLAPLASNDSILDVPREPQIILAGSGPGSPHLLTMAAHRVIQNASVILADKLVPAPVLDLIPRRTPVHIARKFPGNADAAQQELLELGLEALKKGLTVLRLKQGDPYIYGRGGEEFAFFRDHGYTPIVLPGITSSLSAPIFAAIPPTHRSVADQVLICTGTGRKGAAPSPPPYVETQTVIFLMALHRLSSLVSNLTNNHYAEMEAEGEPNLLPWPMTTPCAVIERASCPDQRVIRSTLQHVVAAVDEEGSRPPGLLVVGQSCEVLKEIGLSKWVVEDGFAGFDDLMCYSLNGLSPTVEMAREGT